MLLCARIVCIVLQCFPFIFSAENDLNVEINGAYCVQRKPGLTWVNEICKVLKTFLTISTGLYGRRRGLLVVDAGSVVVSVSHLVQDWSLHR